jgi:hypothetical protein
VRLLRHAACLLLGAAVGLASVVVHRSGFPWGLGLGLAASYATAWWLWRSPSPRAATTYVAGWVLVLLGAVTGRPEGDYALAGDVPGYALLAGGLALVPVGVLALAARRRPRS